MTKEGNLLILENRTKKDQYDLGVQGSGADHTKKDGEGGRLVRIAEELGTVLQTRKKRQIRMKGGQRVRKMAK